MVKKIKHVALNRRTPPPLCSSPFQGDSWMVATNDDPTIGTQENPYTIEEFNWLVLIGEWPGGWVEFFGFVPWNLEDWYGSFSCSDNVSSYPDDDDDNDNDDDEHGADGNEEGGEHHGEDNHEGENQGGNQDEGNHGGGNGDSGGNKNGNNHSNYDGINGNTKWDPSKYMCFYSCMEYCFAELYGALYNEMNKNLPNASLFGYMYCYGLENNWIGTEIKADSIAPNLFNDDGSLNNNLIKYIRIFFNTSGWIEDRNIIKASLQCNSNDLICIGILGNDENRYHAVILQSYNYETDEYHYYDAVDLITNGHDIGASWLKYAIFISQRIVNKS